MRKVLVPLALISSLAVGCARYSVSENVNSTNANLQIVSNSESNSANTNAKVESTPLPVFTDASEAVAVGDKLFDASDNEKAIQAYKQAVKLNPDFAEAYFKLGLAYSQLEIEQKNAGIATDEEQTNSPAKKGKKEVQPKLTDADKAFENAVKAYKKILEKNPKDDVAQFNLGRAYNKLNQDTDAQKALTQAVKLKPDDSEYQTELGAILIKLAKYDEALPALKKAVSIDADNLQAQDLLEKAQAGKKRIDFGINAKLQENPQQSPQQQERTKQRSTPKTNETPKPKEESTVEKKNTNLSQKPPEQ
jgi:tetratricopeptide (TPR) repeat protein